MVAAITGGPSGIGVVTVKLLSSLEAKVSIGGVSQASVDAAKAYFEENSNGSAGAASIFAKAVDIRSRESFDAGITAMVQWGGALDGAVNLAVVVCSVELEIDLEIDGPKPSTGIIKSINLKDMNAPNGSKGGIFNAASILILLDIGSDAACIATKHGVLALTRAATRQCISGGVRVNAIALGIVESWNREVVES
ncbi:hypothetical protein BJ878DRAFT_555824 [Calycina marina]|uniref:Uncharacterized protein n=1 Tax=Calycina marina TaxID=1763456 RepID=A0A9P8CCR8_9HELO|nr:hypothetical protein BJ878DRAFT_555824 [Calycina marina]